LQGARVVCCHHAVIITGIMTSWQLWPDRDRKSKEGLRDVDPQGIHAHGVLERRVQPVEEIRAGGGVPFDLSRNEPSDEPGTIQSAPERVLASFSFPSQPERCPSEGTLDTGPQRHRGCPVGRSSRSAAAEQHAHSTVRERHLSAMRNACQILKHPTRCGGGSLR
jgi:hypothetical protein